MNRQPKKIKRPTRHVKDIQSSIGTADDRPGKPNLPAGIQISELILEIEGEKEDDGQLEHAMVSTISKIKAIDPQSLEEAIRRPDLPKMGGSNPRRTEYSEQSKNLDPSGKTKKKEYCQKQVGLQNKKGCSRESEKIQGETHCQGFHTNVWN